MTAGTHTDRRQILRGIDKAPAAAIHRCVVNGCPQHTLRGYVACRPHWLTLRQSVRYTLAQAFRRRTDDPELYAEAVALARRLISEANQ